MTPRPATDPDAVRTALARIFGAAVAVSVCPTSSTTREAELSAGRRCAREALAQLGSVGAALIAEPDGAPRWPEGFLGSISHSGGWAVAVAARNDEISGLGVDLQRYRPAPAARLGPAFVPVEAEWVESWEPSLRDHRAAALFTMKESAQKCVRSAVGVLPSPDRLVIRPDWPSGRFQMELQGMSDAAELRRRFSGAFDEVDGLLLAGTVVSALQPPSPSPETP